MTYSMATIAMVGGFVICIAAALILAFKCKSETPDA